MKELVLKEKTNFMGIEIPIIEGGFGEGQKVILAKTVAEIHGVSTPDINKLINRNIEKFTINDLLDLKTQSSRDHVLQLGFTNAQYGNASNIFLLSQRGYTKLVAMMDNSNDKKWDVMNSLIDDYFNMKVELKEINQKDKLLLDLFSDDELKDILNTSEGFRDFMKLTTIKIQKQKLERWKDIENYEGLYRISSLGRVKSLNYNHTGKAKIMKPSINKYGYLGINLCKDGKMKKFYVHRLVAQAFISNDISERDCIDHINTIKTDNRACNLKWVTPKENSNNPLTREKLQGENHPMYGRTGEKNGMARKVRCLETNQIFNTLKEAGEWCGLKGLTSIINQLKGRARSAGKHPITGEKLHWEYVDEETIETNLNLSLISNISISLQ